jgi:hypothetical protein
MPCTGPTCVFLAPRVSILVRGEELHLHTQVLREHRAFQSAYLGQGVLLGLPGEATPWCLFGVFFGLKTQNFRLRRLQRSEAPWWPLHWKFSPHKHHFLCFLHLPLPVGTPGVWSRCFGGRGNSGRFDVLFWHRVGTTGKGTRRLGL